MISVPLAKINTCCYARLHACLFIYLFVRWLVRSFVCRLRIFLLFFFVNIFFNFHLISFTQIRANTFRNIHHLWNAITINAPSINCESISIVWTFCAWMSIKCYANAKKCYGIWNGIKSATKVWPMAFCDFHRLTIVQFNLANANTMANKPIIIACKAIAIKSTSAQAMCKCTRIIIARIRLSCKKGKLNTVIQF